MKKILAIITLLSVLSTQLVSYANEDNLYFDMDLSAYTEQNPVVKNKATNSSDGITADGLPLTDTISSVSGETRYITTGQISGNTGTTHGMINLDNTLAYDMACSDELSIEFWAKSEEAKARYRNYKLFSLVSSAALDWELNLNTSGAQIKLSDGTEISVDDIKAGEWAHWVVTRKWNEETQKFDSVLYINAEQIGTASGGAKSEATDFSFTIGGAEGADKTYQGSIGAFRVYKKELSSQRVSEIYNGSKGNFAELPKSINLVSPADGKILKKSDRELVVEFDNYIDKSTVSNIQFLNSDETPFEGAAMIVPDGNTKTVTFELEGLTEGKSFILRIGEVKSSNQYTVTPQDISISVFDSAIAGDDFSDWDAGDLTADPTGKYVFYSSGTSGSFDDFTVKTKTAGGKTIKYLEMRASSAEGAKDSYFAYNLPSGFNKDFVLEVGVRGNSDATSRSVRIVNGSNHFEAGLFTTGSFVASTANGTGLKEIVNSYDTSVKDDFGFVNMVYTFIMEEDGTYRVYGTSPDNAGVSYEAKTKFSQITQIRPICHYNAGKDGLTTELSHFKIYEYVTPKISASTVSQIKKDSDYIEFSFDDDMTGFTNDSFKLSKAGQSEVDITYEGYNQETRTAKIKINEYLDFGVEYVLTAQGPKNLEGTEMRKSEIRFTVPTHEVETTASQDTTQTTISLYNNANSDKTVLVTTVMYDASGKILKTVGETVTIPKERRSTKYVAVETNTAKTLVYVFEIVEGEYRATTVAPFSFEN